MLLTRPSIDALDLTSEALHGLLINSRSRNTWKALLRFSGLHDSRHWLAVVCSDACPAMKGLSASDTARTYVLIDSKRDPVEYTEKELRDYLADELESGGEIFSAVRKQ